MYITDMFLKTPLSIYFNFFPNSSQNLSSQSLGAAYLENGLYASVYGKYCTTVIIVMFRI